MLEKNYVDLGYYSFESTNSADFSSIVNVLNPQNYKNIIENQHIFPLRLNITEDRLNPVNIIPDDLQYFRNSYFSIVNETLFYEGPSTIYNSLQHQPNAESLSIFISEKTFKCLALKHPFVVFGRPNTLKELRNIGFKTLSPYFNESYDNIINDNDRFDSIFNEITRLINLSDDEWLDILKNIEPILEHNHQLFLEKKVFGVTPNPTRFFC
jgi:hypothetical protein